MKENLFNSLTAYSIISISVLFFFLTLLFNSADLCSLGAPTTVVVYCVSSLIFTVVHQQRQHYGIDYLSLITI